MKWVIWHYTEGWKTIFRAWGNFLWFCANYFSIALLLRTFLTPWKRMGEGRPRSFDPAAFLASLIVNGLMRVVGVLFRTAVLFLGIGAEIFVLFFGLCAVILWPFLLPLELLQFVAEDPRVHAARVRARVEHADDPAERAGAEAWVAREEAAQAEAARFWERDQLARIPGLAKDWGYGETPTLDLHGTDLTRSAGRTSWMVLGFREEIERMESVLAHGQGANIMIVGDPGAGAMESVYGLADLIRTGGAFPALEHKRVVALDGVSLLASAKQRSAFETLFLAILSEAERAGDVILVLTDFSAFTQSAESIGSDVPALLARALSSPELNVIAVSDPARFHRLIEPHRDLIRAFEKILIEPPTREKLLLMLESAATAKRLPCTYLAIEEIAASAQKYFPERAALDAAFDLLREAGGLPRVTQTDVQALVSRKTKIPMGAVGPDEREKLLHLEERLSARVVGQREALGVIANALRRMRSGIRNEQKPIGSFLFLGPTGVGKTETAKALAAVYFSNEDALLRLDMTEYQKDDALARLIGSFESGKPGVLANLLREHQYGVVLLDEFEKTNKDVLNLFLQIFDEGFFSDMSGARVNARNAIFIATSNAAADTIWKLVGEGKPLAEAKDAIINELVAQGVFKPELLNRFDAIVLYHPLELEELRAIARILLGKMAARLAEKGILCTFDDSLVGAVVEKGSNRLFGARPMARFLQEHLEQRLATRMIAGELARGAHVELTAQDLLE